MDNEDYLREVRFALRKFYDHQIQQLFDEKDRLDKDMLLYLVSHMENVTKCKKEKNEEGLKQAFENRDGFLKKRYYMVERVEDLRKKAETLQTRLQEVMEDARDKTALWEKLEKEMRENLLYGL